ncbi:hypothetical protein [Thiorhodococcus minor]|uniref:Uncharacterized protein n=1 Tax=Thiorhodococcus minor TaxID=57489 RepID=A0A6M0JXY2_9GAMM|nr:hypothetical protein [Thiorhodococcus minor]NEV61851.1 hypothetical protein [Thiorhodococcus minor]
MRGKPSGEDLDRTDAAFNQVLEAEAQARLAVEECRWRAAAMLAAGAERIRDLERRTEARLLLSHRLSDASVVRALDQLKAEGTADEAREPEEAAIARLDGAVEMLADEMIGASSGAGGRRRSDEEGGR